MNRVNEAVTALFAGDASERLWRMLERTLNASLIALDPLLQYGALGLLAIVVTVSMAIAWSFSRALVKGIAAATAGLVALQDTIGACMTTLLAMRTLLAGSMFEARSVMEGVRRQVAASRCVYDRPGPKRDAGKS